MKSKLQSLFVCKTNQTYLQFIRYLGVGALAAAVNIGLLAFFKEVLSLDYLLANVFGFMGGLTINYLLSRVLVFSADGVQDKTFEFTFYALIGVLGLALDTILLWVGTQLIVHYWGETPFLGIKAYLFAKIISTGLVFIWNFGARKVLYTSRRLNAFRLPAFSAGLWLLLPVLVLVHTVAGGVFVSGNNWPNASVMKFVNNWLDEGALNLQLALYEYPASIEFNSFVEREAYVSYPPGSTILPWLFAKAVGMTEMTLEGSRQYSSFMLLLEVLLVGVIFYFILLHYLKVRRQYWLVASSAALALCWMFLPVSIFQLRNACFADQSVTAFALAFILLEITRDYFTGRYPLLKYPWLLLLFFVGVCGVLVDYYILFVLFIAWLVRAISLVRKGLSREIIGKILRISVPYIAAVVVGLSLFALWLSLVPGGGFQCLVEKMQQRTALLENGRFMLLRVGGHFLTSYTFAGVLVMAFSFLLLGFYLKKMRVPGFAGTFRGARSFGTEICLPVCFFNIASQFVPVGLSC